MPAPQVKSKWRPRLALIVYSVLLSIMALPIISIIWFRTIDSTASLTTTTEAGALLGVLLGTLGVAYVLSRNITGPINALISRSDEIAGDARQSSRLTVTAQTRLRPCRKVFSILPASWSIATNMSVRLRRMYRTSLNRR
jgi:hypothetical protein